MWSFFKNKIREKSDPVRNFEMQFKVTYKLADGGIKSTGTINITIPARSEAEAERKLKNYAIPKIDIRVLKCDVDK